jgi:hypothetical protein
MDELMADELAENLDDIERIDRLTTIAESRRNDSLREIERRRAVRNVSTILRQSTVEFRLGFSAFSATAVRLVRRPAVELGGRVWPDGIPYQGWPSAPTFGG